MILVILTKKHTNTLLTKRTTTIQNNIPLVLLSSLSFNVTLNLNNCQPLFYRLKIVYN